MKTVLTSIFIVLLFQGCGAETEQEKNQQKAVEKSIGILYDLGKMSQDGASDQEVQNSGIDKVLKGLEEIGDESKTPLTEEEKKLLEEGGDLLKDDAKGLKQELLKALKEKLNSEELSNKK